MRDEKSRAREAVELRRRAEELLQKRTTETPPSPTEAESQKLLHELQVHQTELEMQNTELRHARDELETALERYTDLYDFAPVGYFTLDREGIIRDANLTGALLLGIERSRLIGRRFESFVSGESRSVLTAVIEKILDIRNKEVCEVALLKKGDRPLYVQIQAMVSVSGEECRLGLIDISIRRQAEEELKGSEKHYRSLFENMLDGFAYCKMLFDDFSHPVDFIYLVVNDSFERLTGLKNAAGKKVTELIPGIREAHPELFEIYGRVALTGRPESFELEFKPIKIWFHISVYSLERETFIAVFDDITERMRAKEQIEVLNTALAARAAELETANIELETFTSSVSHDLRRPLGNINGYCQVLQQFCADKLDEQCSGYLRSIYEATLTMTGLIETLLNFSRILRVKLHHDTVDLSAMVQALAASLKKAEPDRRVDFRVAEGITVNGDASLLEVVLNNLIGNAWKYSGKRDEAVIEFGATEREGKPAYFIRDNGCGFDMADAGQLFAPFQRLHSEEFEGHGIGLATVERIIRRHGGRVWAESELDKGATFYFTLQTEGTAAVS